MSWLTNLVAGALVGADQGSPEDQAAAVARFDSWEASLRRDAVPPFVTERIKAGADGRLPWLSTMTPAELLLARSHGIRPVGTVSGTCWLQYNYSWTKGHAEGWHAALRRMKNEALAAGANAIVDVRMRTVNLPAESSMDFTVIGTAVRMDGLPPSPDPAIATVPALEFVRLLEAGIVPTGIAIGAHYEWLTPKTFNPTGNMSWANQQLPELSAFWERVRRVAHRQLREDTLKLGNGVLAHTQFGQLLRPEEGRRAGGPEFLGRHIVIGTAVHCRRNAVPHGIGMVIDMRDDGSPLLSERAHGHTAYALNDKESQI